MLSDSEKDKQIYDFYDNFKPPMLVLAVSPYYLDKGYHKFKDPSKWKFIETQHGGHACHHKRMYIYELEMSDEIKKKAEKLSYNYCGSDIGIFGTTLDEINDYRKVLKEEFDVDCNWSYRDMEEALYPIDCNKENIAKLTISELPDDLDDLLIFEKVSKFCGCVGRFDLYILGENCD